MKVTKPDPSIQLPGKSPFSFSVVAEANADENNAANPNAAITDKTAVVNAGELLRISKDGKTLFVSEVGLRTILTKNFKDIKEKSAIERKLGEMTWDMLTKAVVEILYGKSIDANTANGLVGILKGDNKADMPVYILKDVGCATLGQWLMAWEKSFKPHVSYERNKYGVWNMYEDFNGACGSFPDELPIKIENFMKAISVPAPVVIYNPKPVVVDTTGNGDRNKPKPVVVDTTGNGAKKKKKHDGGASGAQNSGYQPPLGPAKKETTVTQVTPPPAEQVAAPAPKKNEHPGEKWIIDPMTLDTVWVPKD